MRWRSGRLEAAALLLAILAGEPAAAQTTDVAGADGAGARLAQGLEDPTLRSIAVEILERNPELSGAAARARAAALKAPQVRALPDPMVGVTAFVAPPETRVGPQRLMVAVSQRLPWLSKLGLAEQAAVLESAALTAGV